MTDAMLDTDSLTPQPSAAAITWKDYAQVSLGLSVFAGTLVAIGRGELAPSPRPQSLLLPVFALVAWTALIWLLMVVFRNAATIRGMVNPNYFVGYTGPAPEEWIERPARTFDNLMQVPNLFYVACALMMITHHVDRAQLAYCWVYVAMRAIHAIVYIGWNFVPYRFATWIMSCTVLGVIWTRFAMQVWPEL